VIAQRELLGVQGEVELPVFSESHTRPICRAWHRQAESDLHLIRQPHVPGGDVDAVTTFRLVGFTKAGIAHLKSLESESLWGFASS
jgi:hypothetical protein